MSTERLPFFVYGTLRAGEGNYRWALSGRTTSEQRGTLAAARMYDQGGFPFVVATDDPTETVVGEVMTVPDADYADVQRSLDSLEGFRGENNPMNMYDRRIVEITLDTGETVRAYTYLTAPGLVARVTGSMPRIESGDWVAYDQARPATSDWFRGEDLDEPATV